MFLGRAFGSTLLCPTSAITSKSVNPTKAILKQIQQLLDYIATHEDAILIYI